MYKPTEEMKKIERHLPDSARFYLDQARESINTRRGLEAYVAALDIVDPKSEGTKSAKSIINEFYDRKIAGDAALSAGPWEADVRKEFEKYDGALILMKDPLSSSGCYIGDPKDYERVELMIASFLLPRMNDGTEKGRKKSNELSSILTLLSIPRTRDKSDLIDIFYY